MSLDDNLSVVKFSILPEASSVPLAGSSAFHRPTVYHRCHPYRGPFDSRAYSAGKVSRMLMKFNQIYSLTSSALAPVTFMLSHIESRCCNFRRSLGIGRERRWGYGLGKIRTTPPPTMGLQRRFHVFMVKAIPRWRHEGKMRPISLWLLYRRQALARGVSSGGDL